MNISRDEPNLITKDDYSRYLEEAITALRVLPQGKLGTLGESTEAEPSPAAALLEELKTTKNEAAEFSKELGLLQLQSAEFEKHGLQLDPAVSALMERFDFYLLRVPVTLIPRPGFLFWRLHCVLELNPGREAQLPVAYSVFPTEDWATILKAHQSAQVGVDERLAFRGEFGPLNVGSAPAGAQAEAGLSTDLSGGFGLTVGRFDYHIQRPNVLARGKGSSKVRWTLDGKNQFKREDLELAIVMQVPNTVQEVSASAALLAYREFDGLMAQFKDVWEMLKSRFLSREAREFFDAGAPIPDQRDWRDITRGV